MGGPHDGRRLLKRFRAAMATTPAASAADGARLVWQRMCAAHTWRPSYRRRALTGLLRALEAEGDADLARALNPLAKPPRAVHTASSHETRFTLHDCLPLAVRRLFSWDPTQQAFLRLAEGLVRHMRSSCRHTLQKRLLLVHRLVTTAAPAPVVLGPDIAAAWANLRALTVRDWLGRLDAAFAPPHRLRPTTFQAYLFTLRLVHDDVLGPDRGESLPVGGGGPTRLLCRAGDDDDDDYDKEAEQQGHCHPTLPGPAAAAHLLERIRARVCGEEGPSPPPTPAVTAFSPAEVERLIDHAVSTRERLMQTADVVVQDDTGIPFRRLQEGGWAVRLYGVYTPPLKSLRYGAQPDLEAAYRTATAVAPLDFPFGYHGREGRSALLVARRGQ